MQRFFILSLTLSASLCAQTAPKLKPGFDPNARDKTTDPCVNFYQHACGNWLAANPIPAERASYGRFTEISERNQSILRDILETTNAKSNRTAVEQKIGDYFAACMDETGSIKKAWPR